MKPNPFAFDILRDVLSEYGLKPYEAGGACVFPMYGVSGSLLNAFLLVIVPQTDAPRLALPIKFWEKFLPERAAVEYAAKHFPELALAVQPDGSFPNPITELELLEKARAKK